LSLSSEIVSVLTSGVEFGLLNGLMVVGLGLALRFGNFPDLTLEGVFSFGASVCAISSIRGANPIVAIALAGLLCGVAGVVTATLHLVTKMSRLLAAIIVMTALFGLSLRVLNGSNLSISGYLTFYQGTSDWLGRSITTLSVVLPAVALLIAFLHTEFGVLLRASGENWHLLRKLGKPCWLYLIVTLAVSSTLVGVSGALTAQYNGFADVGFGSGTIVTGLASLLLGEAILTPTSITRQILACLLGSFVYSALFALIFQLGLNPWDFKIASALFVLFSIAVSKISSSKQDDHRIGCNPL
jgi:putative tryptophan/tyrosine transport system permease protein